MKNPLPLLLAFTFLAIPAFGQVIYDDTFSGSASELSGTQPPVDGPDQDYGGGDFSDGNGVATTTGDQAYLSLPLSVNGDSVFPLITSGYITLSGELISTTDAAQDDMWSAIGFTTAIGSPMYSTGADWIFLKGTGVYAAFTGNGASGNGTTGTFPSSYVSGTSGALTSSRYFEIQLDLADNTVTFYDGATANNLADLGTYTMNVPVSSLTGIELYGQNSTGSKQFDDLELSYATTIPEPGAWTMLGCGLSGLAAVLRFRRASV